MNGKPAMKEKAKQLLQQINKAYENYTGQKNNFFKN
jgi:hypothetical protein